MTPTTWDLSWAEAGIRLLAEAWRDAPERPRVAPAVLDHWDDLIAWWVDNPDLPLPIRNKGTGRGSTPKIHERTVVFVDNSPPQWVFARACEGWTPTRDELGDAVVHEMPVAQILTTVERETATLTRTLGKGPATSHQGLKLHHIDTVSLGGPLAKRTIEQLEEAAVRLLNPRNMFVLPKQLGGLGEVQLFIDVMRPGVPPASDPPHLEGPAR